ncbi:Signal transduction histidine kinase [Seinonella peptonophila]|uniref:histidine kinase n=1 Tax=Seinonella peptonophila TaxID=112248 RepID=A0A1M4ST89_9BACL|nr:HAMP domain-containing sensor histidine kinase [Seinonella peptonophila]SHE35464.1 Signal transduction histidine kinase [Seinonella peptonophila]
MLIKTLPLRLRLTLLMAIILSIGCISLMVASIYAARVIYVQPQLVPNADVLDGKKEGSLSVPPVPPIPSVSPTPVLIEQQIDFASAGFLCAILIIASGTGITYMVTGRALKPVTNLSKEIEEIDENNLYRQVQVPLSKDEVASLSVSFNRMVHKLQKSFLAYKHFSANAAHELKTPLAAMLARIEVVQLSDPPILEEYTEALEDIRSNVERLNSIVHDLLQMNTDMNGFRYKTFKANELFQTIIREFSLEIQRKHIHVEIHLENVLLYGEKNLLYQAFSNILHNSIKYNKENGNIQITAVRHSVTTCITIADTGIGIPEDQIDKIFDPFYCVDKSRSSELGGNGLGLSIVKAVIDKHNGSIQVHSEAGIATTFVIQLPNSHS